MQVTVQKQSTMDVYREVNKAYYVGDKRVVLEKQDEEHEIQGEIVNAGSLEAILISNYYGSDIKRIKGSDIHRIQKDSKVSIYCDSVMKVSNRLVIKFSSKEVEISANLVCCFDTLD